MSILPFIPVTNLSFWGSSKDFFLFICLFLNKMPPIAWTRFFKAAVTGLLEQTNCSLMMNIWLVFWHVTIFFLKRGHLCTHHRKSCRTQPPLLTFLPEPGFEKRGLQLPVMGIGQCWMIVLNLVSAPNLRWAPGRLHGGIAASGAWSPSASEANCRSSSSPPTEMNTQRPIW